ncbi:sporulation histidine kinase inhibitor Sda [Aquibacillus kalidii]|uniref:sporulation histidine kinase inhibitor Sda n=1 Tax=Aquibacillus kalidii TaxID=2762597 RepID=UPI0016466B65|nr:sporulation histidine kinase inhibitor Sda [Aquibacillus kalidii]
MNNLSDDLLVDVFIKAVTLGYDEDFIILLEEEIKSRGISLEQVLNGRYLG